MPKNKIDDLRNHLFEALERLSDKEDPLDVARAKAIADVSRVIVDSAKVEVAYLRETGRMRGSGFLPEQDEQDLKTVPGRRAIGEAPLARVK